MAAADDRRDRVEAPHLLQGVPDLADELLGADSRRDDRCPDGIPRQPVARAKILVHRRLLPPGDGKADDQDDRDVPEEEDRIERSEHRTCLYDVFPVSCPCRIRFCSSIEGSSINPARQKEPHAHSIVLDAANRYALAPDLGIDKVMVYRFDREQGKLLPGEPPFVKCEPGAGPRHLAFGLDGKHVYVIEELSSTVAVFAYGATSGTLKPLQTVSTLPQDFRGANTCAEVQVHPSGRFLYGSNRGHNSIAAFVIGDTGTLHPVGHE